MAAPTDQQFLICAIEHAKDGKVDWKAVAEVYGLKQGTAYMRFTRMKAKFGTGPNDPGTNANGEGSAAGGDDTPKKPKKTPTKKSKANKKRRLSEDDDEEAGPEPGKEEAKNGVKGETDD